MINKYPLSRYGQWAGEPNGRPYVPSRCAFEVFPPRGIPYQCRRKRVSDGLFCKQHAAKMAARTEGRG